MSKAPYNFISLENDVYKRAENREELPKHNSYNKDLNTGEIKYKVEIKTPLFISAGEKKENEVETFIKNPKGDYVIPGNTMRGMLRNVAAIYSKSSVKNDIEDQTFYYRTFASSDNEAKNWYKNKTGLSQVNHNGKTYSVLENVNGGYLYYDKNIKKYYIVPAVKYDQHGHKRSYFPIYEKELKKIQKTLNRNNYMYNDKDLKYKNRGYKPYSKIINYNIHNNKPAISDKGKFKGLLTNSSYINGKKNHYIIFEEDKDANKIEISNQAAAIYEKDLIRTAKITQNDDESFYKLEGHNYPKAIFYIYSNNNLIFGFTPYLRIPADNSIYNGISDGHMKFNKYDYTNAIFGTKEYKTRVAFEDLLGQKDLEIDKIRECVLSEPKPSWYKGYLKREQQSNFYGKEGYSIRGRKFYWLKEEDVINTGNNNKKLQTKFKPIKKGTFIGKIRFTNLTDDELGLLLVSMTDENLFSIGKAKSYGLGQVIVRIDKVILQNFDEKYSKFDFSYGKDITNNQNKYIESFRKVIDYSQLNSVAEYHMSKTIIKNKSKVRYMNLKEFRNASELPTIKEVIEGKVSTNKAKKKYNNKRNKSRNNRNNYQSKNKKKQNQDFKDKRNDEFNNNPFGDFLDGKDK